MPACFAHSRSRSATPSEISPDLIDDAEGKGLDLINTLRERGRNASPKDKALASAN